MKTRKELIVQALTTYPFRQPRADESGEAYVRAFIAFVADRDLSMAHELRIGKAQTDWTPDDVVSFEATFESPQRTKRSFAPSEVHAIKGVLGTGFAVTEASLRRIATNGLDAMKKKRVEDAAASLPIFASVLLMTGDLMTTTVSRGDRIAVLKALAQQTPAFGFVLVFDAFIHQITKGQSATKTDALLAQIGTREMRITVQRPYRLVKGRAVFDDPPPPDIDLRAANVTVDDPYAEIFVSVPASDTPQ